MRELPQIGSEGCVAWRFQVIVVFEQRPWQMARCEVGTGRPGDNYQPEKQIEAGTFHRVRKSLKEFNPYVCLVPTRSATVLCSRINGLVYSQARLVGIVIGVMIKRYLQKYGERSKVAGVAA